MDISDRNNLEELIAYSKSFKPKDGMIQQEFINQTPPEDDFSDEDSFCSFVSQKDLDGGFTMEAGLADIKNFVKQSEQSEMELIRQLNEKNKEQEIKIQAAQIEMQILEKKEIQNPIQNNNTQQEIKEQINKQNQITIENPKVEEKTQVINTEQDQSQFQIQDKKVPAQTVSEFTRVSDELLETYFGKAKNRKSLMTERIKTNNNKSTIVQNNGNGKIIKLFLFNTAQNIKVKTFKTTTVADLLRLAIEQLMQDNNDKKLIRYPNNPTEAYDIRIIDDESDGFTADMGFPPLNKANRIMETSFDAFALIECGTFKPPPKQQNNFEMINQIENNLPSGKNNIVLQVLVRDENSEQFSTLIQLEKTQTIKDIFDTLYKKNKKYNCKEYVPKIKIQPDDDFIELDLKLPVLQLQNKSITLFQKEWADKPAIIRKSTVPVKLQTIPEDDRVNGDGPINQTKAFNYEEFKVIKINEKGKRQERYLGINQFRIYNINKKMNIIDKLFNPETGTRFPERLIEDILDIQVKDNLLNILFKQEGPEKQKELRFDTIDPIIAQKIEGKLNFIRKSNYQVSRQMSMVFNK